MLPLYEDPCFTFRFADDRIISRIHLEAVDPGHQVVVHKIDPISNVRLGVLTSGIVGDGGWVDFTEPILVKAGEAFVVTGEFHEFSDASH